jgi:C1A family cysteine protease
LLKKAGKLASDDMFSERFTYYVTRAKILNWNPTKDAGAYIRDTIKAAVRFGTCLEQSFPYNGDYQTEPAAHVFEEAKKYEALTYATFPTGKTYDERKTLIQALKNNLNSGYPLIAGFHCYSNLWSNSFKANSVDGLSQNIKSGIIPPQNGQIIGGHAVLVVGYDDNKQLFKFKNSWSVAWGDKGYGYLPYSYFMNGDMFDIWTIFTTENNDAPVGITLINPQSQAKEIQDTIADIFTSLAANAETITDQAKYNDFFTNLAKKYQKNAKMVNLINTIRLQMGKINTAK